MRSRETIARKNRTVYQLNVSLRDIEPPIWRRIQIWDDTKLSRLHRIIQMLFHWEDCHLHEFVADRTVYGIPDRDDEFNDRLVLDEKAVPLNRLALRVGGTFDYLYDFGDYWQHEILVEAIVLPEPGAFYPRCLAGARNGPPEDSGGIGGYAHYVEALADPDHEEHEDMLAWRGPFDPEAFSLEAMNASLRRRFDQRPKNSTKTTDERHAAPEVSNPRVSASTERVVTLLRGDSTSEVRRKRIRPDAKLPLELTDRERELILQHGLAPEELTQQLRVVPSPGRPAVVRYTLADLDELGGYVAFASNHAKDRKLHKEWQRIFAKIDAILESYTDE